MTREEIIKQLTPICKELFKNPNLIVTETLDATQVEGWSSLTFMQLLEKVEELFHFKFKVMELIEIKNIGDLVDIVMQH